MNINIRPETTSSDSQKAKKTKKTKKVTPRKPLQHLQPDVQKPPPRSIRSPTGHDLQIILSRVHPNLAGS